MIEKNIQIEDLKDIFNEYKNLYNPIISDFTKIYVYTLSNKVTGFVVFDVIYDRCDIVDIFVSEKYRRKHIAQNLLNEIIKDYKINNMTLEVSKNNISAIKFYETMGFKKVAIRKNYYKDSDGLLMLKEIR